MASTVTRQDPRYPVLRRGRNARFPANESDAAARIEVCETATDVASVLQRIVDAGLRPTVRSGGHCYEDFVVNNPNGVIVDVSLLDHVGSALGDKGPYQIGPGAMLGEVYSQLYRRYNLTLPGGSCYSVGVGGHLSGGGYGLLTRLQGLSVDLISAIDVLTIGANGKVVNRHVDWQHDPSLFRALRGGGGASFGIITNFYFDRLPPAPRNLITGGISFPWETMTEEKFVRIAQIYGDYFEQRGQQPDTWGLFAFLRLTHRSPGSSVSVSAIMHDMNGKTGTSIPDEFLDRFVQCGDARVAVDSPLSAHAPAGERLQDSSSCIAGQHRYTTAPWIEATISGGGGPGSNGTTRSKYKSCYMRKNFTEEELRRMYKHLTRDIPGGNTGFFVSVDSYGGAMNRPELAEETAIPQRSSILKLQYQMYWQQPEEDEARLKYLDELYTDVYSANVDARHAGTPFHNDRYEGCYINYPDQDMTRFRFWPELYYGTAGLYPFLQAVKRQYDPNNVFHHSMAIRA